MEILIDNRQEELEISKKLIQKMKRAIEVSLKLEGCDRNVEISISFVTDNEIRNLNKEYRGMDNVTDVLSFPMDIDFIIKGENKMLGDIIISTNRAKKQAKECGHSIEREIIYLTIHSIFHLLGYDHIEEKDKLEMRKLEKEAIKILGIYKNER